MRGGHPTVKHLPHAAAGLLDDFQFDGARVKLSAPQWSHVQKEAALKRGPHQSTKAHMGVLRGEFAAMIQKKQWILLSASLVMTEEELRLSPLGFLPQREWRPRSIIDYMFYLINEDTVVIPPQR
jgi:hypothetical protein